MNSNITNRQRRPAHMAEAQEADRYDQQGNLLSAEVDAVTPRGYHFGIQLECRADWLWDQYRRAQQEGRGTPWRNTKYVT